MLSRLVEFRYNDRAGKTTSCWVSLKVETPGSFMKCCYLWTNIPGLKTCLNTILDFFGLVQFLGEMIIMRHSLQICGEKSLSLARKERLRQYGARVQKKPLWLFSFTSTFGASGCVPCQVGVEQSTTWKIFAFRFYPGILSLDFDYLSLFIPKRIPVEEKQDKNSLNATFLTAPFLPWAAPAVSHL